MTIEIVLKTPDYFHDTLHEQIPSKKVGNQLFFNKEFGEGGMVYQQLQEGLYINHIEAKLNKALVIHRVPKDINDYFILNFHLSKSNIIQKTLHKEYKLGFESTNILLASATTEANIIIPPKVPIKIFNIGFTKEWFLENVFFEPDNFLSIFKTNEPIYLFETINFHFKKKLKLIDFENKSKLSIASGTLQLLDYFFQEVSKRNINSNVHQSINHHELSIMLKIREQIEHRFDKMFLLDELAVMAGMSLSKFKIVFKQLFGTTPYQYYLANRMEKSMELLALKKYSVTEVSYIVGYSNPSQFSKSFQKHFGKLPSEVK